MKIFTLITALALIGIQPIQGWAQSLRSAQNVSYITQYQSNISKPVQETQPVRSILASSENSLEVQYDFKGFTIADAEYNEQAYQYLHISGFPKMGQVGSPALPVHNDVVLVPSNDFSIEIVESEFTEYSGFNIYPALEAASDEAGQPEPEFVKNQSVYTTNAFWPSSIVEVENVQAIRGVKYAVIQIRPIQFNPATGVIRAYSAIRYRIIFTGATDNYRSMKQSNSDRFLQSMRDGILNSQIIPEKSANTAKNSNSYDVLLLTTPAYMQAADSLAQWKRQLGYSVKVIANSGWTSSAVYDTVHNAYLNQTPHPDYLIILGDHADVPAQQITYSTTYYLSDLYYVCMDGAGDYLADMARGRISVNSASQALEVVLKIINYERNPVADQSFYNNVMSCGYFQDGSTYTSYADGYADRRFLHTAEEIRSYLLTKSYSVSRTYFAFDNRNPMRYNNGYYSDGQLIPSDLMISNGFQWNGNSANMISHLNTGAFLMYHRDHGYVDGYGWEHPYFLNQESNSVVTDGNHINQLNNGNKLPVVFSINCHTGDFKRPECFAENFLRKSNGGAVGVFAPSYASYSGYNDALIVGLIDAIWSNPGLIADFGSGGTSNPALNSHGDLLSMGDVLNQGLLRMVQTWAASTKWKMQNEIFHYFGDPTMKIWTGVPTNFALSNPINNIIRLDSILHINISNCTDATYTLFVDDSLIASGELVSGSATIQFALDSIHNAILTISKSGFKPIVRKISIDNTLKPSPPTAQASNIRVVDEGSKSMSITLEWDKGDGDFSLVKISDSDYFTDPVDGTEYSADPYYSGSGEQVVFSEMGNSVTIFNIEEGQIYWFRVYEYNNEGIYTLYQTNSEIDNPNALDGGGGLLPIELGKFEAVYQNGEVLINWTTNAEHNNDYFIIEKSSDAAKYITIGQVDGNNNSNISIDYSFAEENPNNGIWYYRLKQVDFDGEETIFKPVSLNINQNTSNELITHYTVLNGNLILNISESDISPEIRIVDITGRIIETLQNIQETENSMVTIPVSNLKSGVYLIQAVTYDSIQTIKLQITN